MITAFDINEEVVVPGYEPKIMGTVRKIETVTGISISIDRSEAEKTEMDQFIETRYYVNWRKRAHYGGSFTETELLEAQPKTVQLKKRLIKKKFEKKNETT